MEIIKYLCEFFFCDIWHYLGLLLLIGVAFGREIINIKKTMATKEEILSTFKSEEGAWFAYKEGVQTGYYEAYNSLRNQAAIAALQGLLANPCRNRPSVSNDYVKLAIDYANALVEQLKKK